MNITWTIYKIHEIYATPIFSYFSYLFHICFILLVPDGPKWRHGPGRAQARPAAILDRPGPKAWTKYEMNMNSIWTYGFCIYFIYFLYVSYYFHICVSYFLWYSFHRYFIFSGCLDSSSLRGVGHLQLMLDVKQTISGCLCAAFLLRNHL